MANIFYYYLLKAENAHKAATQSKQLAAQKWVVAHA